MNIMNAGDWIVQVRVSGLKPRGSWFNPQHVGLISVFTVSCCIYKSCLLFSIKYFVRMCFCFDLI